MKVNIHITAGVTSVELVPDTPMESLVLAEMRQAATKGAPVDLKPCGTESMSISVGRPAQSLAERANGGS